MRGAAGCSRRELLVAGAGAVAAVATGTALVVAERATRQALQKAEHARALAIEALLALMLIGEMTMASSLPL